MHAIVLTIFLPRSLTRLFLSLLPHPYSCGVCSTEVVNFCCCFNRGQMTLGAHVPSAHQASGSVMDVGFEVANQSTTSVSDVSVKVKEIMTWQAQGHTKTHNRVLAEMRVPAGMISSLKAYSAQEYKAIASGMLAPSNSNNQQRVQLHIPESALETYHGALVTVRHVCSVTVNTGMCVTNPKLKADLLMYRNAAHMAPPSHMLPQNAGWGGQQGMGGQASAPPIPPDWNPAMAAATASAGIGRWEESHGYGPGAAAHHPQAMDASTDSLLRMLSLTFDVVGDTRRWVQAGGGPGLTPQCCQRIVAAVRTAFDQPLVMREVMEGARAVVCQHVAAAVGAADASVKAEVASQMAHFVTDSHNASTIVRPVLSAFQWAVASPHFIKA